MLDLGTVKPGTTLYIPFQTFDSNDPSASVTLTGLATTDIEIYKDGSVTQRASDAGYSLLDTDGIDFDTTTGIHGFSVDLADNTTAGFYASGSQYWIVVASVTVDAATVNFIAATFRIGYPDAIVNTTVATYSSQTSFTLTAGSADNDAYNGMPVIIHDVASGIQVQKGIISDYVGSTKTVTLDADPGVFTFAATDNVSIFIGDALNPTARANIESAGDNYSATRGLTGTALPAAAADAAGGVPISDAGGLDIDTLNSNVSAILSDTGTDGVVVASINANAITATAIATDAITAAKIAAGAITDTEFTATGSGLSVLITDLDDIKGTAFVKDTHSLVNVEGYVDILDDATSGNVKIAADVANVLVDTADMQPKLGTPAADLSADIAAVKTDTGNIETDTQNLQSRIPAALVSGRMSSDMVALSGNTTAADNLEESAKGIISGSTSGTPTTTTTDTDLTGYLDDELIGRVIVFTGGTAAGQASDITDYASTNGVVTMTALATAPAASDTFVIV